jgi:hypothetical protein
MRDAKRRTDKYKAKIDGEISQLQLLRYGKPQKQIFKTAMPKQVEIERQVKNYLAQHGIGAIYTNYYILFAKNMVNPHPQECDIEFNKWAGRDLSWYHLRNIGRFIFNRRLNLWNVDKDPETVLYLPFSEGEGITTKDCSGNGNDGSLNPYAGSVTDEGMVSVHDTWVQLDHTNFTAGTVVVTDDPFTVTYVEGVDYNVDYAGGMIMALSTGAIGNGQNLLVDCDYSDSYPTWVTGELLGNCLYFDGIDDFVTVAHNNSLNFTDTFTTLFWGKSDVANWISQDNVGILDKQKSWRISMQATNGIEADWWNATHRFRVKLREPITTDWVFMAVVWNFEGGVLVSCTQFINDERYISNVDYNPVEAGVLTGDLLIGKKFGFNVFAGHLDEIRIFNRGLTDEEILNIYNAEKPFHY